MSRGRASSVATVALAVALSSCAGKTAIGDRISGGRLTIYSSVPLHGSSRASAQAVVNGAELALARIGGRIGRYTVVLKPLDDSTAQRGRWDPGQTNDNARQAVQDKTTIGYIGEFNSGASAVSIPLLNRAGIAQISPTNTAVGLTTNAPGASPGEPAKYYPTGVRTYARVVPDDAIQAAAQVRLERTVGCTKTYVVDDGEVDGQDTATSFSLAAQSAGLQIVGSQEFSPGALDYTAMAANVAGTGADCVFISADTENNAVAVTKAIATALPHAKIFAAAGVAESAYTDPAQGGIPLALDPRVLITVATLDPGAYPPSGRAFYARYAALYGQPQPSAIYGYEAMGLMLDAIARGTHDGRAIADRSKVVAAIFATRDRHGAVGTYSINGNGDTSLTEYGVYRVVRGRLEFWKAIEA